MVYSVEIDSAGNFRDRENRVITLRGINLSGDSKLPATPAIPSHVSDNFFDGDNVSFVGKPFPLDEADSHLGRIASWGFNVVRYVFTWEALEHAGPGQYDEEFIQSTIQLLAKIKEFGFYCYMDPHQDVWSRFSGGSGAPMWTLYAAGLDPTSFAYNEAALVQNTWPDPATFPRMTWATNYERLVCLTMNTLFWAGRDFAPNAIIDGVNIQDYLQDHFINAVAHFAEKIEASGIDDGFILGWETMNEPNRGMLGFHDISVIPDHQKFRSYTCPTPYESLLLGSGRSLDIPIFQFGPLGSYKSGSKIVNETKRSAWIPEDYDDSRYGWKRSPLWKKGSCIWAQHGVYDAESGKLLKSNYFLKNPDGVDLSGEQWADVYYINHWHKYVDAIRNVNPDAIVFAQTPVLAIPPDFIKMGAVKPRMVFTPHYYDGLTLIRKHWSSYWNVDVVGVLRGRYWSPAFALRFGERSIRNCLRDQLTCLKTEGIEKFGRGVPCLMSEIGVPFDMNDKKAYETGDYNAQVRALDANIFALEGSMLHHTYWTYAACNTHQWGDHWNGEDLSFYSGSDAARKPPTCSKTPQLSQLSLESSAATDSASSVSLMTMDPYRSTGWWSMRADYVGSRAAQAFVRPFPLVTAGLPREYGFDLAKKEFSMVIVADDNTGQPSNATQIHVPELHFPNGVMDVRISSGRFEIDKVAQRLRWWHDDGVQSIRIFGLARDSSYTASKEADADTICSGC
ncbi:glycoside hydrolase superfamily [Myxozyma melibiosi]|uniref:Glycoside hydrolase superfamily n=1 Tax=Myxozyma melibiosi TaxID=54550 RepID=A0ABR1FAM3_9ASCO